MRLAKLLAFSLSLCANLRAVTVSTASPRRARGALGRALRAQSAEDCAAELAGIVERFIPFPEVMPQALRGEWSAITVLVRLWLSLVDDVLELASDDLPDLVHRVDDRFAVRTATLTLSEEPVRHLDHMISDVPFSPLLVRFGAGVGVGVVAIHTVRFFLPGCLLLRVEEVSGVPISRWDPTPSATVALWILPSDRSRPPWST